MDDSLPELRTMNAEEESQCGLQNHRLGRHRPRGVVRTQVGDVKNRSDGINNGEVGRKHSFDAARHKAERDMSYTEASRSWVGMEPLAAIVLAVSGAGGVIGGLVTLNQVSQAGSAGTTTLDIWRVVTTFPSFSPTDTEGVLDLMLGYGLLALGNALIAIGLIHLIVNVGRMFKRILPDQEAGGLHDQAEHGER